MFESNYPTDGGSGSYSALWNAFKRVCAGVSADEKADLFARTAARFAPVRYCLTARSEAQTAPMKAKLALLVCASLCAATPSIAKEPAPLAAYGDLPGVESMAISHDGKRVAAISQIKQDRQLLVTENGALVSATPIGDMKVRRLDWAGDKDIVLEKSNSYDLPLGFSAKKAELFSAIAVNLATRRRSLVFADTPWLSKAVFGSYGLRKIGGRWSGFYAGIKYKRSPDRTGWEFDHGRPAFTRSILKPIRPDRSATRRRKASRAIGWSMVMAMSPPPSTWRKAAHGLSGMREAEGIAGAPIPWAT